VDHLLLEKKKLYVATDSGDFRVIDLSNFYRNKCELLRDIWRTTPVVWAAGKAVSAPVPKNHHCFQK